MTIISPSILSADFLNLGKDIQMINNSTAEWIHFDVMDGVFVPNISYGIPILEQVRKVTNKILDVHLMIVQPEKYIDTFYQAGADILVVHYEACTHLHRTIQQIKEKGMRAGVAINPHTPISMIEDIIGDLDLVLLMSVNPGYGGQKFIEHSINKLKKLRKIIDSNNYSCLIEIDGGVNLAIGKQLVEAGADILVAGSYVFNSSDPTKTIEELQLL